MMMTEWELESISCGHNKFPLIVGEKTTSLLICSLFVVVGGEENGGSSLFQFPSDGGKDECWLKVLVTTEASHLFANIKSTNMAK